MHNTCSFCVELKECQVSPSELLYAISKHTIEVTRILTTRDSYMAKIRARAFTWAALRDAAKFGRLETIEILLASGVDVDYSIQSCDEGYARTHGEQFAFTNDRCYKAVWGVSLYPSTSLMAAVEQGHIEIVRKLIDHRADVNAMSFGFQGSCALESAIVLGYDKITRILIDAGASVPSLQLNGNRSRKLVSTAKLNNTKGQ